MISKYGVFCKVIELKSFTKVAETLNYTQSAISQTIKSLEQELGVTLIDRRKDGIRLSPDGEKYYTYILSIYMAEQELEKRRSEILGMENASVRIGTFTSVSRNMLPQLMSSFKKKYPNVNFVLKQGEYTSIENWIKNGSIDFGFVNADAVSGIEISILYSDEMRAVLPTGHSLANKKSVSLKELADEQFILLDEGDFSVSMASFSKMGLSPKIAYEVYDDYTILEMVKQGLGVSLMYQKVLSGSEEQLEIRPIKETPKRIVALAWNNWKTMPYAAKMFAEYIMDFCDKQDSI